MSASSLPGYDIIGDIHGCATELEALLNALGYTQNGAGGAYRHPQRTAVFVGDLIDRGPEQLRVLQIVKAMVDSGSAQMVLGNHEFNAMAYATEWPAGSGKYLRPHDDPTDPWSAKNESQHRDFLAQVTGADREHYLAWFWTQPLWLDLGGLRVVHACWHGESIAVVERELGGSRFIELDQLVRASTKGDPLYTAVETLLKGPEISLVDHGHQPYVDKDGHSRDRARLRWWHDGVATLHHLAEMGGKFFTSEGDPYPTLPETEVATDHQGHIYQDQVPVFYGHYWRSGAPTHRHDWTDYTACVDFSAVKGGQLTAYRWSGEKRIQTENYVSVAHSSSTDRAQTKKQGRER
ncbi:metallophosphoesterase [Mycobacterium sp. M26]|uniref:metallophosphoesterase n=1 Tax=Mycobacterium sp. M26 TaxID=1762962 RepID=UPI00073F06F6|nr:metallophosphoesterase [Mycobacterium sp. M26]